MAGRTQTEIAPIHKHYRLPERNHPPSRKKRNREGGHQISANGGDLAGKRTGTWRGSPDMNIRMPSEEEIHDFFIVFSTMTKRRLGGKTMGINLARHAMTGMSMTARVTSEHLSPGMVCARNTKRSYFRVLDGAEARNCPYIGGEKRN